MREYMKKSDNNNNNNNNNNINNDNNSSKTPDPGKRVTSKQVVAIVGVLLLVLLYIVTLVVAIFDSSESGRWFMICIFATVAVPILLWVYTWMYGKLTGRHTIANTNGFPDPNNQISSDAAADKSNIADSDQ